MYGLRPVKLISEYQCLIAEFSFLNTVCSKSTGGLDGDSEVRGYCSKASEVVYICIDKGGILGRSQIK